MIHTKIWRQKYRSTGDSALEALSTGDITVVQSQEVPSEGPVVMDFYQPRPVGTNLVGGGPDQDLGREQNAIMGENVL